MDLDKGVRGNLLLDGDLTKKRGEGGDAGGGRCGCVLGWVVKQNWDCCVVV